MLSRISTKIARTFSNQVSNTSTVTGWAKTIASKATTAEGKLYSGQLTSLINFYNKGHNDIPTTEIDWNAWETKIQTPGIVEKVRDHYDHIVAGEYNVEGIAQSISTAPSKDYTNISQELIYHYNLWNVYHQHLTHQLVELESVGNLLEYKDSEYADKFAFKDTLGKQRLESHHYLPGSMDDVNNYGYFAAQFGWGKMVITYYRHPADDFKCVKATKNILGK